MTRIGISMFRFASASTTNSHARSLSGAVTPQPLNSNCGHPFLANSNQKRLISMFSIYATRPPSPHPQIPAHPAAYTVRSSDRRVGASCRASRIRYRTIDPESVERSGAGDRLGLPPRAPPLPLPSLRQSVTGARALDVGQPRARRPLALSGAVDPSERRAPWMRPPS